MTLPRRSIRSAASIPAPWLALGLTALADVLFYRHAAGWTLGVYPLLLALVLACRARPHARRQADALLALALVPCVALTLRTGWLAAVTLTVLVSVLAVTARGGAPASALEWPACLGRLAWRGWGRVWADGNLVTKWRRRAKPASRQPGQLLRNWLAPLGMTLVFLLLFAAANPVLTLWLRRLADWLGDALEGWVSPLRWVFWFVTVSAAWALLRHRPRPVAREEPHPAPEAARVPGLPLVRTLGLFNAVFLLQNSLDMRYLWLGADLPGGMTYAHYAHRGAYPLVATALLAAAFILRAFRPGRQDEPRAAQALVHVWIAQNVFLTVSSAWRLWLYVGVYGLTRLRAAAAVWMALVAAGLVLAGVRIALRRSNDWLVHANLAALFVAVSAWSLTDIDGRIARFNVTHCRELGGPGVPIDLRYLRVLGPAALPALDELVSRLGHTPVRTQAELARRDARQRLNSRLEDWRAWTLESHRLKGSGSPAARGPSHRAEG